MRGQVRIALALALALLVAAPGRAGGGIPVSGRPVPELATFDDLMASFMTGHDIQAGVLGVMKDGRVVYQRGFGHGFDGTTPLPENALFRIASCSKPITIAAIRQLFDDEDLDMHAFDLDQPGGGLLDYEPFPSLGDARLKDVTLGHLIAHGGGWDRDTAGPGGTYMDVTFLELIVAAAMGVPSPPGRMNQVRWILGQELQFTPGTDQIYSNVGCYVMGLIVEQQTGQDLIDYVRQNVLTADMWVPATELQRGRTFREWQDPREPLYADPVLVPNVFSGYGPPLVLRPYGGWHQEALIGNGGYVASAATMLEFLQRYHVGVFDEDDIGKPLSSVPPASSAKHNGALSGLNTLMVQRADGVNVFIAFNKGQLIEGPHFAELFYGELLDPALDEGGLAWPERTSDGFWVQTAAPGPGGAGGYHDPFKGVGTALDFVADGSKLRLQGGSSPWTGVISRKLLIDAPLGPATIGQ